MKLTQKDMELVKHHMKVLDIPEAEAIQLVMDDKAVDKGEKLFELSAEQKKVAKKYAGYRYKKTNCLQVRYRQKEERKSCKTENYC